MDQTHNNRSADSAISEFLGVVAHRIHTPVAAIKWQIESLLDGMMGELSNEQKEALQSVMQSAENLNDFSRVMLVVYEMEKDIPLTKPQEITLHDILQRVQKNLNPLIRAKLGRVVVTDGAKTCTIIADPDIAFTILHTFVENGLHYSPEDAKVIVNAEHTEEGTLITVEDFGCGIPSDVIPSIGAKFFRTSDARQQWTDGAGLDLYIAMNLAERTGGRITFESEVGKGSKFHWLVPDIAKRKQPWEK